MLIGLGRQSLAIDEVQEPAVFMIPAGLERILENALGFFVHVLFAGDIGVFHHEPAAFNIVAGVYKAAVGDFFHK